jgi:hypothetical protein
MLMLGEGDVTQTGVHEPPQSMWAVKSVDARCSDSRQGGTVVAATDAKRWRVWAPMIERWSEGPRKNGREGSRSVCREVAQSRSPTSRLL